MKKLLSPSIITQGKLESRSNSLRFTPLSGAGARTIGFGITIGIVSMFLTFNSVHAQSLNPVTTIIPTVSAAKEARSAAREALVKTNADREIERRITALNYVTTRINEIKKLSSDQKASLTTEVQSQIDSLTALKAKIDADTDAATLKTDKQSIVTSYRIFLLFIPKIQLLVAGDRISMTADQLSSLADKLEVRIKEVQAAGNDVTTLTAAVADMRAKIVDAQAQYGAINAEVLPLTPDGYPGNKATLMDARAKIRIAQVDLNAALQKAKAIRAELKNYKINSPTSSSSAAQTTQ